MKKAFIQFDNFIHEAGVGTSLFFVMILLIFVNTLSLYQLFREEWWAFFPSLIGAIAFSITTVVVMRREGFFWAKIIVPLFDLCLMFLGFNVTLLFQGEEKTGLIGLSIFFAVFTAFITGVLGFINYKERKSESINLKSIQLMEKENESNRLKISELNNIVNQLNESNRINLEKLNIFETNHLKWLNFHLPKFNGDDAKIQLEQVRARMVELNITN